MNVADIAKSLDNHARREGRGWRCLCPIHHGRSLVLKQGRTVPLVVHCFGGCDGKDILTELRRIGLLNKSRSIIYRPPPPLKTHDSDDADRIKWAQQIWNDGVDPLGTIAEEYLASRKLSLPRELCGTVLRFHECCPWRDDEQTTYIPALIAAFKSINDGKIAGVHRIRLDQPARWPKAQRKMIGIMSGSAVQFDPAGPRLVIGEGIETCLAARQLGFAPVWSLGSSSSFANFAPIDGVRELVILAENDNASEKAVNACAEKWLQQDRRVRLAQPHNGYNDLNDCLMGAGNGR